MNLNEMFKNYKDFIRTIECPIDLYCQMEYIENMRNISVELPMKTYTNITMTLFPYDRSSGINNATYDLPYVANLSDKFIINISIRDTFDYEKFVFVVGHEFGHLEQEALTLYHKLKNAEVAKGNHRSIYRFTEVEILADNFGVKIFKSMFNKNIPSLFFDEHDDGSDEILRRKRNLNL
jgi:hypothetical protein